MSFFGNNLFTMDLDEFIGRITNIQTEIETLLDGVVSSENLKELVMKNLALKELLIFFEQTLGNEERNSSMVLRGQIREDYWKNWDKITQFRKKVERGVEPVLSPTSSEYERIIGIPSVRTPTPIREITDALVSLARPIRSIPEIPSFDLDEPSGSIEDLLRASDTLENSTSSRSRGATGLDFLRFNPDSGKKNEPINKKLYEKVKKEAKKKFDVYPSIYANAWLVREYKKRGGKYKGKKSTKGGLTRWFDEEWINVCKLPKIVKCGRPSTKMSMTKWKKTYPYCRPRYKVSSKTPVIASSLTKAQIKRRCKSKKRNPRKRIMPKKSRSRKSSRRRSRSKRRKSKRKSKRKSRR